MKKKLILVALVAFTMLGAMSCRSGSFFQTSHSCQAQKTNNALR